MADEAGVIVIVDGAVCCMSTLLRCSFSCALRQFDVDRTFPWQRVTLAP